MNEVTPFANSIPKGYSGSEADTQALAKVKKGNDTVKLPAQPQFTGSGATAPQLQRIADDLLKKVTEGRLPKGNLELAALLGFQPAQLAMKREISDGMTPGQLIQFLLTDPNLTVSLDVPGA